METFDVIVRFFQNGGVFMYPIGAVMTLGVAITIERFICLGRVRKANRKAWKDLQPVLARGDYRQATAMTADSDAVISKVLNYGLSRIGSAHRRDDIEMAMEEGLLEVVPTLEKRTHYLATFANVATLMGLLGTIAGLIQAFTSVANASAAEKADALSAAISVAMNCTAFGLLVAIPLVLIYSFLQSKTTELVDGLEMAVVKSVNALMKRDPAETTA
jgi:biopolymer transport protein ExbB